MRNQPLAQVIGTTQTRAICEALKPYLQAAGVRTIEQRIGKPPRFFANVRHRGTLRVRDLLATCAALDLEPDDFISAALAGNVPSEVRPPRIVASARRQLSVGAQGLGTAALEDLEASLQTDASVILTRIAETLQYAVREEVPQLLGIYASALRVLANHPQAALVLGEGLAMTNTLSLKSVAADLLIRRAYVALDWQSPRHAINWAKDGTLCYTRLEDREGEGKGFLAMGIFEYKAHEYEDAIDDCEAALRRVASPARILTAYQVQALSWLARGNKEKARARVAQASEFAPDVTPSMRAKLSWVEGRLAEGDSRYRHLKHAQQELQPCRPGDCIMVTIELIEELLKAGRLEEAAREIPLLCTLVEEAGEVKPVHRAVSRLIEHRARLRPGLIRDLRQSLERSRDRRLASVAGTDL